MTAAAATITVLLAGCAATSEDGSAASDGTTRDHSSHGEPGHGGAAPAQETPRVPLREGERRISVTTPEPYDPAAPTAGGVDDYRCFLVDPGLDDDALVTGTDVSPGDPSMVHHVILFRVPPQQVEPARTLDVSTPGQGWPCFGGSGLDGGGGPQATPWLGAWTPGSRSALAGRLQGRGRRGPEAVSRGG